MRGTNTRLGMIVAALILAIAASAAVAIHRIGNGGSGDNLAKPASRPAGEPATQADDQNAQSFDQYAVVSGRDIFKPLVAPPAPKLQVPNVPSPSRPGGPSMRAATPPSPTADLAMTGVVERGGRVQALVQNIKTGEAQYVTDGSTAFGLHVVRIEATAVVFSKGGKEYTLRMGEKTVPDQSAGGAHQTFAASGEGGPSTGSTPGPGEGTRRFGFGRRGGGSGGNLDDMQRRLDEARASGRMSDEQYQRAQRYMQMRRGGGGGGRGGRGGG
jgi:hypothetical protein